MTRRLVLAATVAGVLLVTSITPVAAQSAATERFQPRLPSAAVSLGDSYISGEAARWQGNSADPAPGHQGTDRGVQVYGDTVANGCHRSDVAPIDSARLRVRETINLACSGARTVNVLRASAGGVGLRGEAPQNDQLAEVARTHEVELVVLSIGGNDLGFGSIVGSCVTAYLAGTPACSTQQAAVEARLPQVGDAVAATVADVRATMAEAGYRLRDYRLVLQSYPSPLAPPAESRYTGTAPDARATVGGCPILDVDAAWAHDQLTPALSGTLAAVARRTGSQFLDLTDALRGHELCAAAAQQSTGSPSSRSSEWVRFVDLARQGDAAEALHPNYFGQQAIGRCLTLAQKTRKDVACQAVPGKSVRSVHVTRIR